MVRFLAVAALSQQGEVDIGRSEQAETLTPTQIQLFALHRRQRQRSGVTLPDRAVHMAAKALSLSLFMTLKQGHCSRVIMTPPVKSRLRYRLSATMHSHRTPAEQREGAQRRHTTTEHRIIRAAECLYCRGELGRSCCLRLFITCRFGKFAQVVIVCTV